MQLSWNCSWTIMRFIPLRVTPSICNLFTLTYTFPNTRPTMVTITSFVSHALVTYLPWMTRGTSDLNVSHEWSLEEVTWITHEKVTFCRTVWLFTLHECGRREDLSIKQAVIRVNNYVLCARNSSKSMLRVYMFFAIECQHCIECVKTVLTKTFWHSGWVQILFFYLIQS